MKKELRNATITGADGSTMEITRGSGNVFADLGLPDADELHYRAQLSHKIAELMRAKNLNQTQLAQLCSLDQADVSRLLNHRRVRLSLDRMLSVLNALGRKVEVRISKREYRPAEAGVVIRYI